MSNYFLYLRKNFSFLNILLTFTIIYLPIFSFGIFAPSEIFFANYTSFGVIFDEFGWKFLGYGTLLAVLLTFLVLFLPKALYKICLSFLVIFSVCGYIQTMFLNTNIDQIGATTDGYLPTTEVIIKNCLIWLLIILLALVIILKSKGNWKNILFLSSLLLLGMQGVAYGSLLLFPPTDAMEYAESDYYLSGEKQYTVSSQSNVIVFILDTVSNVHYQLTVEAYPEIASYLSDFTYYNNNDCNYYGTFPSIAHILTGHDYDTTISTNDWIEDCWTNKATNHYYDSLHEAGYQINVFAVEPVLFTASHPISLLENCIDNLTTQSFERQIHYKQLYETLLSMSCYRFMPNFLKPFFDVPNTQYATIVTYPDNIINYTNPDFYSDLTEYGLTVNTEEKYIIYYHLNGIHELINDENCMPVTDAGSFTITMKGIWELLHEYLAQLQECGVYDSSTIIITSDHGAIAHPQSIFFIKEANEYHEQMQMTNAPISLDELAPTIAQITTGESAYLGQTIYEFKEDEQRERTLYIRALDENYPSVKRYDGKDVGGSNVYRLYTYTGNYDDYLELYYNDIFTTVPLIDSYF